MGKTVQIVLEDDVHREFKLWCTQRGTTMAGFLKGIVKNALEGVSVEKSVEEIRQIDAYRENIVELPNGKRVRLMMPSLIEEKEGRLEIMVPEDTSEQDLMMLGTARRAFIKINDEWKTEMPMEVLE